MPYVALEDVGTTRRGSLSGRRRLQAWERTGGICVVCDRPIDGVRERWIVEHIWALELGGADALENMGPAHEACGREKTRADHARTARAKRRKIQHLGAAVSAWPLPGSRDCALKRKINGTVVPRGDHAGNRFNLLQHTRKRGAPERAPRSSSVDASASPTNRLCTCPATYAKENEAGTGDPTTNREPPLRPRQKAGARQDVPDSADILPSIPAHLDFLFHDRPLLPGESAEQYDAVQDSIVRQVMPHDVIEAIWVKDITDLVWEAKRLRRWRGQILVQGRLKAAAELIRPAFENENPDHLDGTARPFVNILAAGWVAGQVNLKKR
jgi:hypothetical protein